MEGIYSSLRRERTSKITFCPGAAKGQEAVAFRRGPRLLPLERNERTARSVGNVSSVYPVLDNKWRDRGRNGPRNICSTRR